MVTANVRLTRPLGEGAMGCVWVAEHLTLRTDVAVKFISAQIAGSDPQIMARFLQEASVAAQIKSPHVVQTFDQGVMGDGTPYIVMELLEGESLQEHLNRAGRVSLALAARILTQLSRALGRAHEIGVVHRDIKPDNIFLVPGDDGPFCKILDFGIAKQTALPAMGGLTSPGTMVGTPEYMSPEQVLSAKDVDFRADLWGLAVTVYHCITGELPFTAEALGQLCVKLLDGHFTPPSQLAAGIPATVDAWMTRALARPPAARVARAHARAASFTRIVAATQPLDAELLLSATGTASGLPLLGGSGESQQPPQVLGASGLTPGVMASSLGGSLPATVGGVTGPGTLTGSSSSNRAAPKRMPWATLLLGGAAAIAVSVAAVVLVASSGRESQPEPGASAQPEPASAAPPSAATTEETVASASAPASAAPPAPSASAVASASATATAPPPFKAPPRPPPTATATGKSFKPIFDKGSSGSKGKPGNYGF
jgi:serine/threonine protein kinase